MARFEDVTKEDQKNALIIVVVFTLIILVSALLLLPLGFWYLWVPIFVVGVAILLVWSTYSFGYRCSNCGNEFDVSMLTSFYTPHLGMTVGGARKYLKCPRCGQWEWDIVLKKVS
jgi:DNA-directed RNA polymerase subunit RPC12/RpoP